MSLPTQLGAYGDCLKYFSRAASNRLGTRVHCHNHTAAQYLRMRLHQARVLLRRESRRIFPPDHPAYDKSEFDFLVCRLLIAAESDGTWWVYIERHGQTIIAIEDLSDEAADPTDEQYGSLRHDIKVFDQRQLTYLPSPDHPALTHVEDIDEGELS